MEIPSNWNELPVLTITARLNGDEVWTRQVKRVHSEKLLYCIVDANGATASDEWLVISPAKHGEPLKAIEVLAVEGGTVFAYSARDAKVLAPIGDFISVE